MKKYIAYIILAIVVFVLAIVCGFNVSRNKTQNANAQDENAVSTNEIVEGNIENEVENTSVEETNIVEEQNVVSEEKVEEDEKDTSNTTEIPKNVVGTTDKKQEAIDLVKEKWGQDDSVTFRCDSVTSDGEYVIAVISKSSTNVRNYFRVNLDKRTVEVEY